MSLPGQRNDCPDLIGLQILFDKISALKLESETELKRRNAMSEESIEKDNEIWSKIPEELLMVVLSSLPTLISRNLRVICKRWQYLLSPAPIFRQISSTLVPSSSPAFFIGDIRGYSRHSLPHHSFLLHSQPLGVNPLPLDFMGPESGNVLTTCKSILCCFSRYVKRAPTSYYICNPLTRTWITLPPRPSHLTTNSEFGFHGLAFDSATRTCILLIGYNIPIEAENINDMELTIYYSETNEWTLIERNLPISIFPWGEGVYSRGKFYWINNTVGEDLGLLASDVVAFSVAERNWDVIELPSTANGCHSKYIWSWNLTGYDGNVIVVDNKDLSSWKLNEEHDKEERYSWSELHLFPRSSHEEGSSRVVVNSCGWVLVHIEHKKMVVFDAQGRMVRCIQDNLFNVFDQWLIPAYGYEINNVWWP